MLFLMTAVFQRVHKYFYVYVSFCSVQKVRDLIMFFASPGTFLNEIGLFFPF